MGGRGSSAGAGSGKSLERAEASIRNKPYETAIVFNASGKQIINKVGSEHEIKFTRADVSSMKGGVFTHNHPSGGTEAIATFSRSDIDLATRSGLKEIRAVTKYNTYSLTKISNKRSKKDFATDYGDAIRREGQRLSLDITSNKVLQQKLTSFGSNWLKNNASKYGYVYSEAKR